MNLEEFYLKIRFLDFNLAKYAPDDLIEGPFERSQTKSDLMLLFYTMLWIARVLNNRNIKDKDVDVSI